MHASCMPHLADYMPWILTVMTSCMTVFIWVNLINVISSRCLPYLCTQEGVSPRIPSNLMMSRCPHGICLHSLILISQSAISLPVSQSAFSSQFRPCPHGLQKWQDTLCFLHSDSDQQKDNINRTQPLASSACFQQDAVNHMCFSVCYHPWHPR